MPAGAADFSVYFSVLWTHLNLRISEKPRVFFVGALCFWVSGGPGFGPAARPAARQSGLDQEVLRPWDLPGAVEEPLHGPPRRIPLHL